MKFIGLAVETAVYLRNKCPHAALPKQTPHFRWFGKKPDLSNLRVFGTVCYPHIPHETRQQLEYRARRAYLVGYSDKAKAWKLYNIETGSVIESAHVRFLSEDFNPNTESSHLENHKNLIAELLPPDYFKRIEDDAKLEQLELIKVQSFEEVSEKHGSKVKAILKPTSRRPDKTDMGRWKVKREVLDFLPK